MKTLVLLSLLAGLSTEVGRLKIENDRLRGEVIEALGMVPVVTAGDPRIQHEITVCSR